MVYSNVYKVVRLLHVKEAHCMTIVEVTEAKKISFLDFV